MRHCILDGGVTDPDIRFKVWYGICGTHITRQDQDGFLCKVAVSFFQVGVLWSSAIFGVWTLCCPVARFYFPAVQWVPASITHSEGEVSLLLGLRSWWSELTYTMSFGLNISMAAAFSCHVCNVMFLALNPQCGQDKELHTIWFWQSMHGLDLVFRKLGSNTNEVTLLSLETHIR